MLPLGGEPVNPVACLAIGGEQAGLLGRLHQPARAGGGENLRHRHQGDRGGGAHVFKYHQILGTLKQRCGLTLIAVEAEAISRCAFTDDQHVKLPIIIAGEGWLLLDLQFIDQILSFLHAGAHGDCLRGSSDG